MILIFHDIPWYWYSMIFHDISWDSNIFQKSLELVWFYSIGEACFKARDRQPISWHTCNIGTLIIYRSLILKKDTKPDPFGAANVFCCFSGSFNYKTSKYSIGILPWRLLWNPYPKVDLHANPFRFESFECSYPKVNSINTETHLQAVKQNSFTSSRNIHSDLSFTVYLTIWWFQLTWKRIGQIRSLPQTWDWTKNTPVTT